MTPATRTRRVALAGNPNTGKTTIFNQLTGHRGRVGNYAGVTVERKTAPIRSMTHPAELIDLPGMYSISARSPDEMVAVDVLLGNRREDPEPPDVLLIVADASNLERNLFLATQLMEAGIPFALLLNMTDVAAANGIGLDADKLSGRIGAPVFPVVGNRGEGIEPVRRWLDREALPSSAPAPPVEFPAAFDEALALLVEKAAALDLPSPDRSPFLLRRALLETGGMAERRLVRDGGGPMEEALGEARAHLAGAGINPVTLEAKARYTSIRSLLADVLTRPRERRETTSDRIDRYLLHPVLGLAVFLAVMLVVFQMIYSWSAPAMDGIETAFGLLGQWVEGVMPEGPLTSFLTGGVIAGVGGVLVFLPQILALFLFISILEDCGYMARAAFLADRLFSRLGMSGRSFIPLLSSFACAIPGIMATRTIGDPRSRLATMMLAPLMSCSARLPVYTLMIAAFVPPATVGGVLNLQGIVLLLMYLVGPAVAVVMALIFRKTLFKGPKPTFLMELPPYRLPLPRVVGGRLVDRAGAFVKKAGTVILAVSLLVWAATYYPRPDDVAAQVGAAYAESIEAAPNEQEAAALEAERDQAIASAYVRQSFLGRAGHFIEPAVAPLGWDWRIGMAVVASFPAREVVVATLGVIFESDGDEGSADLQGKLQSAQWEDGRPLFTLPVAFSIMVFFALCAQCAATLAVIGRETNSWRWPVFSFAYMTALAWIGAFITYQLLRLFLG